MIGWIVLAAVFNLPVLGWLFLANERAHRDELRNRTEIPLWYYD